MPVRGRYAPSPTGALHLGNARMALLAWLDTRSLGGTFVLRMEDLDPQRSSTESARQVIDDLRWLGLDWDEGPDVGGPFGPYSQSDRASLYRTATDQLIERSRAFRCSCSRAELSRAAGAPHVGEDGPRYPGTCRDALARKGVATNVRLRVAAGPSTIDDLFAGRRTFDVGATVGDFVISRHDGVAAYQLAVVVDDHAMAINRVIRGDDLLSSTPRQMLLYKALGLPPPSFGHLPLAVTADGHRLAKRGGALSLRALRARGVRAENVVGLLARGAGLGDGSPVRPHDLVSAFRLERVSRQPAVIDDEAIAAL